MTTNIFKNLGKRGSFFNCIGKRKSIHKVEQKKWELTLKKFEKNPRKTFFYLKLHIIYIYIYLNEVMLLRLIVLYLRAIDSQKVKKETCISNSFLIC